MPVTFRTALLRAGAQTLALGLALALALTCGVGSAEARRHGRHRHDGLRKPPNMPPGWVWPPSAEMRAEGERCLGELDILGVEWKPAPPTRKVVTPIYVPAMTLGGVTLTPTHGDGPYVMDCQMAEAFAAHAGPILRELGVSEIRFGSLHRYDHLPRTRILSRHATGLALDVAAFVTDDGEVHGVEGRYRRDPLLREIEARVYATGAFRHTLTPGNDPRHHRDHFHFEARTAVERTARAQPTT